MLLFPRVCSPVVSIFHAPVPPHARCMSVVAPLLWLMAVAWRLGAGGVRACVMCVSSCEVIRRRYACARAPALA